MFASLRKAANLLFDRRFSGVVITSVVLALVLYVALFAAVEVGVHHLPTLGAPWVNGLLDVAATILMVLLPFFLGAPVAALFGSLFLEQIARKVEAEYYPADARASGAPFGATLLSGLRLTVLVVIVDVALLPFDSVTFGIAEVVTVLANGWLLGRAYFELVALRHISRRAADALRRRHGGSVLAGGIVISILTLVPVADLFAPLFGVAVMVHMFKLYAHQERPV